MVRNPQSSQCRSAPIGIALPRLCCAVARNNTKNSNYRPRRALLPLQRQSATLLAVLRSLSRCLLEGAQLADAVTMERGIALRLVDDFSEGFHGELQLQMECYGDKQLSSPEPLGVRVFLHESREPSGCGHRHNSFSQKRCALWFQCLHVRVDLVRSLFC